MNLAWPRAWGERVGRAVIRTCPEDFFVSEQLGFELAGSGEHAYLYLQKRQLNSIALLQRLAQLSGVPARDIGYSGLKDRNALTQQWFSVGLAGRAEPDWRMLETEGDVTLLTVGRHQRKLRRGVHRANLFSLVLRELAGERAALEQRLQQLREFGVPNYFGGQRFGRDGSTLEQAQRAMRSSRRLSRRQRSLYYSALRACLFNRLLARRVAEGSWNEVVPGDICMLSGSRSFFSCNEVDDALSARVRSGDIHPGLPLWGRAREKVGAAGGQSWDWTEEDREMCEYLERCGLELAWRPTRLVPDDFCWKFCDDDSLRLDFSLGAGSYATALLAELVQFKEGNIESGIGSEQ